VLVVVERTAVQFPPGVHPGGRGIDLAHEEQVSHGGDDCNERYRTDDESPNEAPRAVKTFGLLHRPDWGRMVNRKQLPYSVSVAIIIRIVAMALTG
jgi:hypothetical protein